MGPTPSPAAQPSCAAGPSPEVKLAEQAPRNPSGSERSSPGDPGAGGGGREGPEPEERSVGGTLVGAPAARGAAPGPPLAGPRLPPSPLKRPSRPSRRCACPCRRRVRRASARRRVVAVLALALAALCLSDGKPVSLSYRCPCRFFESHIARGNIKHLKILNTPNCALQIVARLKNNNRQVCIDPKLKWIQEYLEKALNKGRREEKRLAIPSPFTLQLASGPSELPGQPAEHSFLLANAGIPGKPGAKTPARRLRRALCLAA
ncbi:hypothetical protein MC885_000767 [Smutsia gigantea]|nr:hypothetical protein MC885_000767 [Smutsia gigantea]